jgi:hypothetical protein
MDIPPSTRWTKCATSARKAWIRAARRRPLRLAGKGTTSVVPSATPQDKPAVQRRFSTPHRTSPAVHVLDANALHRFLLRGAGSEIVIQRLKESRDAEQPFRRSVVNWGKDYYAIAESGGFAAARVFSVNAMRASLFQGLGPASRPMKKSSQQQHNSRAHEDQ